MADTTVQPASADTGPKLVWTEAELLTDHDFAAPHEVSVGGKTIRLHGGLLANGNYQPPRALKREQAFDAWEQALAERGGQPHDASADLLAGLRLPTAEQQRVLLRNDLGQSFWNTLTIIGKIEARGRLLADLVVPDLQPGIVEDISEMAIGHLGKGLLLAHGLDEGGEPDKGIGGHDEMWFAARDLAFDANAFPDVEPEDNIGRPDAGERYLPEIDATVEGLFSFLANLLIIEFRAELGFAETQEVLRTGDLFADRRAEAELAAELIERIRIDEEIHVRSLKLYLGELRNITLKTNDGGTVPGAELIDRFWDGLVRWATVEQPALAAEAFREVLYERIDAHPEAGRVRQEFDAAA